MESFIENQGFYDYINHIITGVVCLLGLAIEIILFVNDSFCHLPKMKAVLDKVIELNNSVVYVVVIIIFIIISFVIGTFVDTCYHSFYPKRKPFAYRKNLIIKFLDIVFLRTDTSLYSAYIFNQCGLIKNRIRRDAFINLYYKYIEEREGHKLSEGEKKTYSNDQTYIQYFYFHCVYYLDSRNLSKKTEKLRDVEGLSEALSLVSFVLAIVPILLVFPLHAFLVGGWKIKIAASVVLCILLSIAFDSRTKRAIESRINITLSLYEAEYEKENRLVKESGD